nr:DNA polymerase alpha catalytic subunit [Tanacetum cinerariifolium]
TTTTIFDDEEMTLADTLIKLKDDKAKGIAFKDSKSTDRPARSILTLKPLPTINPKDKGKGVLEELKSVKKISKSDSDDAQAKEILTLKVRIKKLEKRCKPSISHHRAWLRSVSLLAKKNKLSKRKSVSKHGRKNAKSRPTKDGSDKLDAELDEDMEFTHSQLNKKSFEDIQGIYIKEHELIADFVPIGSEKDERMIRDMNKKAEEESSDKEDSTEIHMLAEKRYPLTTRTLERMLSLSKELASPKQTAHDKDNSNLLKNYLVINAPCYCNEALAIPEQMATGKEISNPFMADWKLKIIKVDNITNQFKFIKEHGNAEVFGYILLMIKKLKLKKHEGIIDAMAGASVLKRQCEDLGESSETMAVAFVRFDIIAKTFCVHKVHLYRSCSAHLTTFRAHYYMEGVGSKSESGGRTTRERIAEITTVRDRILLSSAEQCPAGTHFTYLYNSMDKVLSSRANYMGSFFCKVERSDDSLISCLPSSKATGVLLELLKNLVERRKSVKRSMKSATGLKHQEFVW